MGVRIIDRGADYSTLGRGFFGMGDYLDPNQMAMLYLFGTAMPDNYLGDRWDYSLNDRALSIRSGGALARDFVQNGYYTTPLKAGTLGSAFTLFALIYRVQGPRGANNTNSLYVTNYPNANAMSIGADKGTVNNNGYYYSLFNNNLVTVPMTANTGAGWELLIGTCNGGGVIDTYIRRPSGDNAHTAGSGTIGAASSAPLLIGSSGDLTGFPPGDAIGAAGAYSRYFGSQDVENLYQGLRRFGSDWSVWAL
ncbi:hypothetical protein [Methylobacterium sp. JK268]